MPKSQHAPQRVLIVGPIPLGSEYPNGVSAVIQQQMDLWNFAHPFTFVNTEPWHRQQQSSGIWSIQNLLKALVTYWRVVTKALTWRPTIYHHHSTLKLGLLKDSVCCRLVRLVSGARIVLQVHWSDFETLLSGGRAFRRLQMIYLLRSCDCLVFISRNIRSEALLLLGPGYTVEFSQRTAVLHNFTAYSACEKAEREYKLPGRILFLAMLIERKGAHDLLAAYSSLNIKSIRKPELVLAGPLGSEAYERKIRDLISLYGLEENVVLTGSVHGKKKDELLATSDLFVLPSYGEGVPIAILEAMAHGIPIIATNVGGIPEAIRDDIEGLLVTPGNVEELTHALARVCTDLDLGRRMGCAALLRVATDFSSLTYFESLGAIYRFSAD